MAGRKTKLTPKVIQEAERLLMAGNYTNTVCQYLGIHESTWYKWIQQGEETDEGIFADFVDAIRKAEAVAEIRNVNIVQKAAQSEDPKLWTAAMAFLERKFPSKWGRKDKVSADVKHSGEVTERYEEEHTITHKIEQYEDVYSKLAKRGTSQSADESDSIGESIHSP